MRISNRLPGFHQSTRSPLMALLALFTLSTVAACGDTEAAEASKPRFNTACSALSEAMVREVFGVAAAVAMTRTENQFVRAPVPREKTDCSFYWETDDDRQFTVSLFAYFNPPRFANASRGQAEVESRINNTFETRLAYEATAPIGGYRAAYGGEQNGYINSDELHWHFGGREWLKLETTAVTPDRSDVWNQSSLVRLAEKISES